MKNLLVYSLRFLLLAALTMTLSCQKKDKNPEVGHFNKTIPLLRFEEILFQSDSSALADQIEMLRKEEPEFLSYFFDYFIEDDSYADTSYLGKALYFRTLSSAKHFYDTVKIVYPNFQPYREAFENAFAYFEYYFSTPHRPTLITMVSELGVGSFTIDTAVLGIGLDFYLGEKFTGYEALMLPQYIKKSLTPDHMVSKSMKAWIRNYTHPDENPKDVLDAIVRNGKLYYILEKIMPQVARHLIWEVEPDQMQWLKENVEDMWAFALEKEMLYKKDVRSIERMTGMAPTTQGMPRQSPGGALNYLGYAIVEAYMKRNPNQTLRNLAMENNSQAIFQGSKFKPKFNP
jgi:hypothetical protein